METWLLFAIASIFFGGFLNFGMKVMQERKYNISLITLISSVSGVIFSSIYCIYKYGLIWPIDGFFWLGFLAFGNTLIYFLSIQTKVRSLENVDTTIFFPLYKTFTPIIVMGVSVFFFHEGLNIMEFIGVMIGITVPLLLITKSENKIQKNLKLGLTFIILTSILGAISASFPKKAFVEGINMDIFTFFMFLFGTIISLISYIFFEKKKNTLPTYNTYFFGFMLGIVYFLAVLCFNLAVKGNIAIVVTINSFSILIPIILSVIFYKEEMTYKKAFVIFLSIVSVILFI